MTDSEFLDNRDCTLPSLKPCPHCGNRDVRLMSSDELAEEYGADIPEHSTHLVNWAIVCDASTGKPGCGSIGGFADSEAAAVAKWNRRMEL
jgi:Lar family restriction alleviation protein